MTYDLGFCGLILGTAPLVAFHEEPEVMRISSYQDSHEIMPIYNKINYVNLFMFTYDLIMLKVSIIIYRMMT